MHPPIRVLVVDDEESARYLVRHCLPAPAFEVIEVADAERRPSAALVQTRPT